MIILLLIVFLFFSTATIIGYSISGPKYRGPVTDHFNGKKFINPEGVEAKGLGEVLQWMMKRQRGEWKELKDVGFSDAPPSHIDSGIRITFVNHSTFLIQVDGLNILTDPIWSERTSPFSFAGPKRMRPPGIKFEDLPKIDVVLLSHNHWDHLDMPTLKRIFAQQKPKVISPLGVKKFLEEEKIKTAIDLDWWGETGLNDSVKVQAVPAQHFSGRGTFDRDATLWCGYVIKRAGGNIYFVGDTGYNTSTFKGIGERCAPISVALVPIGAYKPQWFMSPIHCSPEEAVKIHLEIKAKQSIATHFGTFPLADDGESDPKNDLRIALQKNGLGENDFLTLKEGEGKNF